jgi:hypothetical protein
VGSERAEARAVVLDALSGELKLKDFHDRWPDSNDPLIVVIFDETEDTIEHVPGSWFWFRRGTDWERFRESIPYKTLVVDGQVLADDFANIPSEHLVEIRERLLKEVNLRQDDESLAASVRAFVASAAAGPAT